MGNFDEIGRLIRQVTHALTEKRNPEKVYRDEPILFTAAQMKSYTPPMYGKMRTLLTGKDLLYKSGAEIFYLQGKFMENMEDDYPFSENFVRYFPTYRELNLSQLRGYFSWRTALRKGEFLPAPIPFHFLYIYELINLIGVSSPEEGYQALTAFTRAETEKVVLRYVKPWLTDFAVYYDLDPACLQNTVELKYDAALLTLTNYTQKTPEEVLDALCVFSSYNLKNSAFYKKQSEDMAEILAHVFDTLYQHDLMHTKKGIFERLFGTYECYPHTMFASAVFYQKAPHPDTVYEISPFFRFRCQNGAWQCERFFMQKDKAGKLGVLLKTLDCRMRVRYGEKHLLKPIECPKLFTSAIDKAIEAHIAQKRKQERPVVEIDRSLLPSIRCTSERTRDKLIVEEEIEDTIPESTPLPTEEAELDATQLDVLRALLLKEDAAAAAKAHGQMLSVVIDGINDALFDRFSDTVIEYDGDRPIMIEDYETELKGMLHL